MTGDATLPRALALDYRSAPLEAADRAMLDYAVKLTLDPAGITAGDVASLRAAGFDGAAILDICQVTAYYNYVNRLADGLGVELEEGWDAEEMTLTRAEFEARAAAGEEP